MGEEDRKKWREQYHRHKIRILNGRKRRKILFPKDWIRKKWEKLKWYPSKRQRNIAFTFQEFLEWYNSQEKKCYYCDITDLSLQIHGHEKGLTLDRKVNSLSYQSGNIVLACWTCNRLKNDYFSCEEFREIAQKYIKPKWLNK